MTGLGVLLPDTVGVRVFVREAVRVGIILRVLVRLDQETIMRKKKTIHKEK
jgi:hypothetical protein